MKEEKELIYTEETEEIELLPPAWESISEKKANSQPSSAPNGQRKLFSGLAIGVAMFAAAFMLCDGAYMMRGHASGQLGGEEPSWLSEWLTGSMVETTSVQVTGAETSAAEPTEKSETQVAENTSAAPAESTAPKESLTPEELYTYDAVSVPAGMIPIVPMDLSLSQYGESFHYNDTAYSLTSDLLSADGGSIPASAAVGEVSVLILHTHATEGYSEEGARYYDPATVLARAEGEEDGVVAVGQVIADILNEQGIVTLHSTVLHDKASYKDSYSRSAQTIQHYLAQYPSIRLVIDVHRDSIMTSSDQLARPVTVVDGEAVAQVMCVVGSDASGASHSGWRRNLALAARLRNALNAEYGNLCRPVYVKKSAYNQQYAPASLLLEIGASGNSQAEAERAAALIAEQIAKLLG